MCLSDLHGLDKDVLTCAEIAPLLGMNPQSIRVQAFADASKLGFPVIVCGRQIRIPRKAFIQFMDGKNGIKD